jgi:hypothetical protein
LILLLSAYLIFLASQFAINYKGENSMIINQLHSNYFGMLCKRLVILAVCGTFLVAGKSWGKEDTDMVLKSETVAARLGGYPGILAFLHNFAVPALLADAEVASFFGNLSETPDDIEQCLAMLLDHDLGGSAPHNGAVLDSGHKCRSSMSNIHRGRHIPNSTVTKFINIVGEQARIAGVSDPDIQAVAKVLGRYRGGVRNK